MKWKKASRTSPGGGECIEQVLDAYIPNTTHRVSSNSGLPRPTHVAPVRQRKSIEFVLSVGGGKNSAESFLIGALGK